MFRSSDPHFYYDVTQDSLFRSRRLSRINYTVSAKRFFTIRFAICISRHMSTPPSDAKYPDTIAITFDEVSKKITCIYNDHSLYVWDVHNIKKVNPNRSIAKF